MKLPASLRLFRLFDGPHAFDDDTSDPIQVPPVPTAGDAPTDWLPPDQITPPQITPPKVTPAEITPATITSAILGLTNPVGNGADRAMLSAQARSGYGVTGAGVKVGILSDSFNVRGGYALDVASGALSAGVQVLQDGPSSGGDEGRAMAELVHQVAPGASLAFYTAFRSEADFANGIKTLAAAGCKVIVDDVTYLNEPFFQAGGAIQSAISAVVAQGVSYFTSASNQGTNFYQHSFDAIAAGLPGLAGNYKVMNFGTAATPKTLQSLTIAKGATATIDLQWDQPFASIGTGHASANSLGLVLYNASGKIVASALANRTGGDPVQILRFSNTTGDTSFRLGIIANGGAVPPNLFKYIVYGSGTTINDPNAGIGSGTIIGHEEMIGANSVGAIAASNTKALGGNGTIESFSSVGPGTILFDSSGNRLSTAISGNKVNFIAPDGIATSVFAPFYGTSAAAPDAAAVAALMLQANASLTPSQVTSMLSSSAIAVTGAAGGVGVGAGLIQATSAVQLALAAKAKPSPTSVSAVTSLAYPTTPGLTPSAFAHDFSKAIASALDDPTAMGDFFVQAADQTLWDDVQNTTATTFAIGHALGDDPVLILADTGTHPLVS
jgi:hypothetical protein